MSESKKQGQKRKKYYIQSSNKKATSRLHVLEPGMKGFLITCNNHEKDVVREAYNLLNEYADQLYGQENKGTSEEGTEGTLSDGEEDMETALKKEVSALKKEAKSDERRFQVVRSGANNCVFIRTTVARPDELVHTILADVQKMQTTKSRFILRMQPVMASCKADEDKIQKMAEEVLPTFFSEAQGGHTYSILFKVRNNNKIGRNTVLPLIGKIIADMCSANKVYLDAPELVVSVDIIRTVCCISVLKDFALFRKYNIQEIVTVKDKIMSGDNKNVTKTNQETNDCMKGKGDGEDKNAEAGCIEAVELLTSKALSEEGESPDNAGNVFDQKSETEEARPSVCKTTAV